MAEAVDTAGLKRVIKSTLEDTRQWVPLSDDRMPSLVGPYKVPHFDAKGEANDLFTDLNVPTAFLLTSFYQDNFIYFGMGPHRGTDDKLGMTLPIVDKNLPGFGPEDIGLGAYGIFTIGDDYIGRTVVFQEAFSRV